MKKIIITTGNKGRLANQLWLYASVLAYGYEIEAQVISIAFAPYALYFPSLSRKIFYAMAGVLPRKIVRECIFLLGILFEKMHPSSTVSAQDQEVLLPPSAADLNISKQSVYFSGWQFRNPVGLEKYRTEIQEFFLPHERYTVAALQIISRLRHDCDFIVGVHIRAGDYRTWEGGTYFVPQEKVAAILREIAQKKQAEGYVRVGFLIASDELIVPELFVGLRYELAPNHEVGDWFALSKTDFVIGSHSTYGAWAAWYGTIPFQEFPLSAS